MLRSTTSTAIRVARVTLVRPQCVSICSPVASVAGVPCTAAVSSQSFVPHIFTRSFAVKVAAKDASKDKKGGAKVPGGGDAAKKKKKKGAKGTEENSATKNADLSLLEQMLEQQLSQPEPAETRTPAELALDHEYAKEYSRKCLAAHKQKRAAQVKFLKSRWTAINALPVPLRAEALKEDMTPWPKGFQPIPWTPQEYVKRFGPKAQANAAEKK